MAKKKIAVLGGGAASLFAVWDLVKHEANKYDITVYQLGWRLGGKGASGRRVGPDDWNRIEEHGLHFMFGFYENVFRVVREAYLRAYEHEGPDYWRRFFKTKDTKVAVIHFKDPAQSTWEEWRVPYPEHTAAASTPGEGEAPDVSIGLVLANMWDWIRSVAEGLAASRHAPQLFKKLPPMPIPPGDIRNRIDHLPPLVPIPSGPIPGHLRIPAYWDYAQYLLKSSPGLPHDPGDRARHEKLATLTFNALENLAHGDLALNLGWFKHGLSAIVRLVLTCVKGVFADMILRDRTWFDLDLDFREWVQEHGGDPNTPIVLGLYDAVFATYSKLATGPILQAFTKAAFLYRGGAIYKMQAGMGDTIFTPLYIALQNAGVKFEFFHRVEHLGLSADKRRIETIVLEKQVEPLEGTYDPLCDVEGDVGGAGTTTKLRCWPSEPLWDRIRPEDVKRVATEGINLESHWTDGSPARQKTLFCKGDLDDDFHAVLLGISVAALPSIASELLAADEKFRAHVNALANATCSTQAMQVWTVKGSTPKQPQPVIVPFSEPYDTVSDMTQLLGAERAPADVEGVTYLCSAIDPALDPQPPPDRTHKGYPDSLRQIAVDNGREWLEKRAPILWENLKRPNAEFDWNALYDPSDGSGSARFAAQWVSTPVNLSDRYVIPVPGSHRHRLKSNGTKFQNLYITGDWIRTSLSIGCLEAAAMAGLQAARAISLEIGGGQVPRARGDWIEDVVAR